MSKRNSSKAMNNAEKINVEEKFDEAINGMTVICKAQIRNVDRIDNFVDTYQSLVNWDLDASIPAVHDQIEEQRKIYDTALETIEGLKLEDFQKKEMDDPIAPFIPDRHGIENKQDMFDAFMIYTLLRPYGERIEHLHRLVLETMEQNGETIE